MDVIGEPSALSTVNESEGEWKESRGENSERYGGSRGARNGMRGRGGARARGSRRAGYNRPSNRIPSDPDYPDFAADYNSQSNVILLS